MQKSKYFHFLEVEITMATEAEKLWMISLLDTLLKRKVPEMLGVFFSIATEELIIVFIIIP